MPVTKEVFKYIRLTLGLTQSQFGSELELSREMIGLLERGDKDLTTATLAKLELFLQKENKYLTKDGKLNDLPYYVQRRNNKLHENEVKEVPVLGDGAVKGTPHGNSVSDIRFTPTEMRVVSKSMFDDAVAILPVFGNSMTPTYPPGSEVALVPDHSTIFEPGEVYAIEVKGSDLPILKRVFPSDKEGCILLYSDNTMKHESGPREGQFFYPPYDFPLSEMKENGKWSVIGDQKRRKNKTIFHRR